MKLQLCILAAWCSAACAFVLGSTSALQVRNKHEEKTCVGENSSSAPRSSRALPSMMAFFTPPGAGLLWDMRPSLPSFMSDTMLAPVATAPTKMLEDDPQLKQLGSMDFKPELTETDKKYDLSFPMDVPATGNGLKVEVEGPMLTLSMTRSHTKDYTDSSGTVTRSQRSSGSVSRSFLLPEGLDTAKMSRTSSDGKLNISFPKTAEYGKVQTEPPKEIESGLKREAKVEDVTGSGAVDVAESAFGRVWDWFNDDDMGLSSFAQQMFGSDFFDTSTTRSALPSRETRLLQQKQRAEDNRRANMAAAWDTPESQGNEYSLSVALPRGTKRGDVSLSVDTSPKSPWRVDTRDHFILKVSVKDKGERSIPIPTDVNTDSGVSASFTAEEAEGSKKDDVAGLKVKLARVPKKEAVTIPIA